MRYAVVFFNFARALAHMADLPTGTLTFLFTDIEGSTRLWETQRAEMQTALSRHDALLRDAVTAHRGHVFKTGGDAFYAAFPTASDAVAAALEAQRSLQVEPWPTPLRLKVRMALHTGAAELRDADYFGEPLNRAARLLAAGHGEQTLVSEVTSDLCRDHLPPLATLKSLGEHHLKDLTRRERVFQLLHPELPHAFPPLKTLLRPADTDMPSIAVLPFVNLSRDEENEYFADGLADELLNMLSKIRGVRVASRTSAFYFKGKDVDLATVAQKLNVAAVLEGSVRKSGNRVRITAQLIQVSTDSHLWSETYDRELTEIFAVQDDIAKSVVTELRAALLGEASSAMAAAQVAAEVETLGRGRGGNAEAYRLYLQGSFFIDRRLREEKARGMGAPTGFRAGLDRAGARVSARGGEFQRSGRAELRPGPRGGPARSGIGAGARRGAHRTGTDSHIRLGLAGRGSCAGPGPATGARERGGAARGGSARKNPRTTARGDCVRPARGGAGSAQRRWTSGAREDIGCRRTTRCR